MVWSREPRARREHALPIGVLRRGPKVPAQRLQAKRPIGRLGAWRTGSGPHDVDCSVEIAVDFQSAGGTGVSPYAQGFLHSVSAGAAILRCVGWVDSFNRHAGAFSLASQSHQKAAPTNIGNVPGKSGGRHFPDCEVLKNQLLPFGNQPSGCVPMKILP